MNNGKTNDKFGRNLGLKISENEMESARRFAKKSSAEILAIGNNEKVPVQNRVHDVMVKLKEIDKKIKEQLSAGKESYSMVRLNYKFYMTSFLTAFEEMTQNKDIEDIENGKLSKKEIMNRASGSDPKSFVDRKVMDAIILLGAEPKLPLGNMGMAIPLNLSIEDNHYNALRVFARYPEPNYMILGKDYKEDFGDSLERLDKKIEKSACEAVKNNGLDSVKASLNKKIKYSEKKLNGLELYNSVNKLNIKLHYVSKIKKLDKLDSKDRSLACNHKF